jgi:hypothetical protein
MKAQMASTSTVARPARLPQRRATQVKKGMPAKPKAMPARPMAVFHWVASTTSPLQT